MSSHYIRLDVHKESVCIAVLNGTGKFAMESVVEIDTVFGFLKGLRA